MNVMDSLKPKNRGGRPKGSPNKATKELKDMILQALDESGGVKYLKQRAEDTPTAFLALIGKVLPLQVTGKDGAAIHQRLEIAIVDAKG